ncbi:hypothetical protein AM1_4817 [Acaryochloris marina MBIC11017]|uniref:Uncharacterized protein n=1 Tax=Acaryochloris marina (strain MBIC 11017) TaxID=329726 RepID=B0C2J7_ACAM1|nr:hypothetical protein AM1_4817 [Acaryochloris marina MBIC11017]
MLRARNCNYFLAFLISSSGAIVANLQPDWQSKLPSYLKSGLT